MSAEKQESSLSAQLRAAVVDRIGQPGDGAARGDMAEIARGAQIDRALFHHWMITMDKRLSLESASRLADYLGLALRSVKRRRKAAARS